MESNTCIAAGSVCVRTLEESLQGYNIYRLSVKPNNFLAVRIVRNVSQSTLMFWACDVPAAACRSGDPAYNSQHSFGSIPLDSQDLGGPGDVDIHPTLDLSSNIHGQHSCEFPRPKSLHAVLRHPAALLSSLSTGRLLLISICCASLVFVRRIGTRSSWLMQAHIYLTCTTYDLPLIQLTMKLTQYRSLPAYTSFYSPACKMLKLKA